jgi:Mn-containing catalase
MGHALASEGRRAGQHPDVFSHIKDLQFNADGIEDMPVPEAFPDAAAERNLSGTHLAFSAGSRWNSDHFPYAAMPSSQATAPILPPGDSRLYCS